MKTFFAKVLLSIGGIFVLWGCLLNRKIGADFIRGVFGEALKEAKK